MKFGHKRMGMMRNRTEGGTQPVKFRSARDDAGLSDPRIGQLIQGRYRLSSRLAAGSTGRVYRAHDIRDLTEVTVKLLPGRFDADDRLIASIRAELSLTRTLASTKPALAAVYDLQRLEDGGALVVMEPLDGTSLADVIREEAPLPVDRALHLALQIAEALETAHNAAFVHGALEAEHVLIDSRGAVKVTGFEVARLEARRGPRSSKITGRSLFSAISKQPAEEADCRGLGRILHDLLASVERPHVRVDGAEPRRKLGRHVPPTVRRLVVEMVAESPRRSGRDMSGLANLLWMVRDRVSGGPVARAWRRWRRIGAFGAAVAAAAVITALGIWIMQPPFPSSRPVAAPPEATATPPPPEATAMPPTPPAATSSAAPSPAVRLPEPLVEPQRAPPPSTVEAPAARPARTQPRVTVGSPRIPEPSALLPAPPAASVAAQPAPPAGESAAPRREPQEPDPSAVIDWLVNEYRSQRH
jgi:serine/threonine protein kinase